MSFESSSTRLTHYHDRLASVWVCSSVFICMDFDALEIVQTRVVRCVWLFVHAGAHEYSIVYFCYFSRLFCSCFYVTVSSDNFTDCCHRPPTRCCEILRLFNRCHSGIEMYVSFEIKMPAKQNENRTKELNTNY